MAKSNPLFIDSTLLRGDMIGTQIEIGDVLLFDGEALYLVLLNENSEEICLPMSPTGDTSYEAFVRLVHQRPVRFYFGIAKEGELLYRTHDYERIAMYALIEVWDPIPVYQPLLRSAAPAAEEPVPEVAPAAAVQPAGTLKEEIPLANLDNSHARSAPVLMAEELGNITQLLNKWGFS
ncbi:MAG: hypothetical protein KF767_11775 [Bdellovibrionaceae bacterium]|nr:hypothetical protein [Pseudobdellovibrionaceae bacterium]